MKTIPKDDPCYWCGAPSTSDEHVPARCLFPEHKDIPQKDFRKNLIVVRSCNVHNQKKSSDDEFLMASIAPVIGNNIPGYLHTNTKLARASSRRNGSLLNAMMKDAESVISVSPEGIAFPALYGKADLPRLEKSLEGISRGLYRFNYGTRFLGNCSIFPIFIMYKNNPEKENMKQILHMMIEPQKSKWKKYGETKTYSIINLVQLTSLD